MNAKTGFGGPETRCSFKIFCTLDLQASSSDTTKVVYVLRFRALRIDSRWQKLLLSRLGPAKLPLVSELKKCKQSIVFLNFRSRAVKPQGLKFKPQGLKFGVSNRAGS